MAKRKLYQSSKNDQICKILPDEINGVGKRSQEEQDTGIAEGGFHKLERYYWFFTSANCEQIRNDNLVTVYNLMGWAEERKQKEVAVRIRNTLRITGWTSPAFIATKALLSTPSTLYLNTKVESVNNLKGFDINWIKEGLSRLVSFHIQIIISKYIAMKIAPVRVHNLIRHSRPKRGKRIRFNYRNKIHFLHD